MQWWRGIDWTNMSDRMRSRLFVGAIGGVVIACGLVGEYRLRKYVDIPWSSERDEILHRIEQLESVQAETAQTIAERIDRQELRGVEELKALFERLDTLEAVPD